MNCLKTQHETTTDEHDPSRAVKNGKHDSKHAHAPLVIGSHTKIGPNCAIEAAAVGSNVIVGRNVVLGKRCVVL